MIPVLMVAPYFAPQTHAAMFRAHKLAKYLPRFGYKPVVVTVDVNYLYNEDPALLEELPGDVEIHRVRYVEPTLRGVRMALGGEDRTFAAQKRAGKPEMGEPPLDRTLEPSAVSSMSQWLRGAYSRSLSRLAEWPDRYWTWTQGAREVCEQLIERNGIRLVYTTAVPISPLRAVSSLKRRYPLTWIADFRDPVGYGQKHSARSGLPMLLERQIISDAMRTADRVVGLAAAYGSIFFDLYGLPESRYRFIPTGVDLDYVDEAAPEPRPTLIHVGEVMPNQSSYLFELLSAAARTFPDTFASLRLEIVGRTEVNRPLVEAMINRISGWCIPIDYIDHLPQRALYQRIRSSRAALLAPGQSRYWWNNFAKLVDYIGLGVPVIADVPPISEARAELEKAGNAHFIERQGLAADSVALASWLSQEHRPVPSEYAERYTAMRQAEDFAGIFDELLGARHA